MSFKHHWALENNKEVLEEKKRKKKKKAKRKPALGATGGDICRVWVSRYV
jgi:hypothetical protein